MLLFEISEMRALRNRAPGCQQLPLTHTLQYPSYSSKKAGCQSEAKGRREHTPNEFRHIARLVPAPTLPFDMLKLSRAEIQVLSE